MKFTSGGNHLKIKLLALKNSIGEKILFKLCSNNGGHEVFEVHILYIF